MRLHFQISIGNPDAQWIPKDIWISMDIHHDQHSHVILEHKETSSNNQTSWDVRPLSGLMMPQITFWFIPAVEATDGLESCNITCFWMISQHSYQFSFGMEYFG